MGLNYLKAKSPGIMKWTVVFNLVFFVASMVCFLFLGDMLIKYSDSEEFISVKEDPVGMRIYVFNQVIMFLSAFMVSYSGYMALGVQSKYELTSFAVLSAVLNGQIFFFFLMVSFPQIQSIFSITSKVFTKFEFNKAASAVFAVLSVLIQSVYFCLVKQVKKELQWR